MFLYYFALFAVLILAFICFLYVHSEIKKNISILLFAAFRHECQDALDQPWIAATKKGDRDGTENKKRRYRRTGKIFIVHSLTKATTKRGLTATTQRSVT